MLQGLEFPLTCKQEEKQFILTSEASNKGLE